MVTAAPGVAVIGGILRCHAEQVHPREGWTAGSAGRGGCPAHPAVCPVQPRPPGDASPERRCRLRGSPGPREPDRRGGTMSQSTAPDVESRAEAVLAALDEEQRE